MEALPNHYALHCNRTKEKCLQEEKASFDGMLKQFQQIFTLCNGRNGGNLEFNKGKNVESSEMGNGNEIKTLCESSVSKAADMEVG